MKRLKIAAVILSIIIFTTFSLYLAFRIYNKYDFTSEKQSISDNVKKTFKPFNIYISGIDTDGNIGRSDMNIIMTVNPQKRKILMTFTPRDSYVYIKGVSDERKDKFTHSGLYGISASMDTISAIYNTKFNYYIKINFTSVINFIDLLGGVDVDINQEFDSFRGYHFNKGLNHLNGKEALEYSRERHAFKNGDFARGENAMSIVNAVIKKMISLKTVYKLNNILDKAVESVDTDITQNDIKEFIYMQIIDDRQWNIESSQIYGDVKSMPCYSYGNKYLSVVILDDQSIKEASERINNLLND